MAKKHLEAPEIEEPDVERVFYRDATEDHGSLVLESTEPQPDVREISQRAIEFLESALVGASADEIARVLLLISDHFESLQDEQGFNWQTGTQN